MTFWIVGGLVVVAFGTLVVVTRRRAQESLQDEAMADRLENQRRLRRKLDELENMRNGGAV